MLSGRRLSDALYGCRLSEDNGASCGLNALRHSESGSICRATSISGKLQIRTISLFLGRPRRSTTPQTPKINKSSHFDE